MSEQAPAIPRRGRLIGHGVMLLLGLVALGISLKLGLWRQHSPGEGLFPFLMALAMLACSGAVLFNIATEPAAAQARMFGDRAAMLRVAAYLGALIFYAVALEALGFAVSTALTLIFILRIAERYSWLATLTLAAGTIGFCYLLFVRWLGAILPAGALWESLFG